MTPRCLHSAGTWTLLAVALIAILVHVCALPFDAHAEVGPVPVQESHHDSPGDVIHAASCEGTPARAAALAAPTLADVPRVFGPTYLSAPGIPADTPTATPAGSRPLFLLHAALLI